MDFKIGFDVRPKRANSIGEIIFEQSTREGLVEVAATEEQCTAYGYEYRDGVCRLKKKHSAEAPFTKQSKYMRKNNSVILGHNQISTNANYNIVAGIDNTIHQENCNLIIGEQHKIQEPEEDNQITVLRNNCIISGYGGNATIPNHYVHAGNTEGDILAERQYTRVIFGCQTTGSGTTDSYINNDGVHFYPIPKNSIMYFNAACLGVRVGGSDASGAVGNYASWLERGVIINQNGTVSIKRTRKTMSTNGGGISNWRPTASADGTNFKVTFRGAANQTIEWMATVDFTEIRAGVDIS